MHPIVFEIPGLGLPIRSFGLMVAAGFLLGMWVNNRLVRRYAKDPDEALVKYSAVQMWVLIGVVLGARLMYVLVEIFRGSSTGQSYLDDPLRVLFIWEGGLVMFGGLFGAMLLGGWKAHAEQVRVGEGLDLGLTSGLFGLAVGRVGCLLVGDDYGKIVPPDKAHLPFPITVHVPEVLPPGSLFGPENAGQVLWATQPWMAAHAALLGLLGLWMIKRSYGREGGAERPGRVAWTLIALYSVGRFTIESFRGDSLRGMWFDDALSTSQVVAIVIGIVSVVVLLRGRGGQPARA